MAGYHKYLRTAFRREMLPASALWFLASDGTAVWLRAVAKTLRKELGDRTEARRILARAAAPAFERRYAVLANEHPSLFDGEAPIAPVMTALYALSPSFHRMRWLLAGLESSQASKRQHLAAFGRVARLSARARWHECATHLGELLIVLTEELPGFGVNRSNALLGRLCFQSGERYALEMKRWFGLPDGPESAIEVLRMGEYIFRVNPVHEEGADVVRGTGFIEGNACPWVRRPGWGGAHCGIFGQFQNGISHAFGLRYELKKTIPRHGGDTCRIELTPIPAHRLRRGSGARGHL